MGDRTLQEVDPYITDSTGDIFLSGWDLKFFKGVGERRSSNLNILTLVTMWWINPNILLSHSSCSPDSILVSVVVPWKPYELWMNSFILGGSIHPRGCISFLFLEWLQQVNCDRAYRCQTASAFKSISKHRKRSYPLHPLLSLEASRHRLGN